MYCFYYFILSTIFRKTQVLASTVASNLVDLHGFRPCRPGTVQVQTVPKGVFHGLTVLADGTWYKRKILKFK